MGRVHAALTLATVAVLAVPPVGGTGVDLADFIVAFTQLAPDLASGSTFHGGLVLSRIDALSIAIVRAGPLFEKSVRLDPTVRHVSRDDSAFARLDLVPNDLLYPDSHAYAPRVVGAEAAWDRTLGSSSVKVAMIDSGVLAAHEDLAGPRLLSGRDFAHNDATPEDEAGCAWHGTHTATIAGATLGNGRGIAGISQHAILPLKAFAASMEDCVASESALVSALVHAADAGSHVSSNSWSGGISLAVLDAVRYAHSRGVVHVAAAGNAGPCTGCVGDPWKSLAPIVLIVSATNSADRQAPYSSEGPEIDLAAPGTSLLAGCGPSPTCYATRTGTSMATPVVAGSIALLKAVHPEYGFADVESCLKTTATDLGAAGRDVKFGHGRIRIDLALLCATPPMPEGETVRFSEGFEAGAARWATPSSTSLWHATSACVVPFGTGALAWMVDALCSSPSLPGTEDWAASPRLDLSGATSATLRFRHIVDRDTDPAGTDAFLVEASHACIGVWTPVARWDGATADALAWTWVTADLDEFAGGAPCLRFHVVGSGAVGVGRIAWLVDELTVTAG